MVLLLFGPHDGRITVWSGYGGTTQSIFFLITEVYIFLLGKFLLSYFTSYYLFHHPIWIHP